MNNMKSKEICFVAVVILFRCLAVILFGVGIFSGIGALLVFNSSPDGSFVSFLAKLLTTYTVGSILAWLIAKPAAKFIVSDLRLDSTGSGNVLRDSLNE